jgi:hypothetical protein
MATGTVIRVHWIEPGSPWENVYWESLLSARSQSDSGEVLRTAAHTYKVDTDAIALKVMRKSAAKEKTKKPVKVPVTKQTAKGKKSGKTYRLSIPRRCNGEPVTAPRIFAGDFPPPTPPSLLRGRHSSRGDMFGREKYKVKATRLRFCAG